jgi:hypothetical protein
MNMTSADLEVIRQLNVFLNTNPSPTVESMLSDGAQVCIVFCDKLKNTHPKVCMTLGNNVVNTTGFVVKRGTGDHFMVLAIRGVTNNQALNTTVVLQITNKENVKMWKGTILCYWRDQWVTRTGDDGMVKELFYHPNRYLDNISPRNWGFGSKGKVILVAIPWGYRARVRIYHYEHSIIYDNVTDAPQEGFIPKLTASSVLLQGINGITRIQLI